MSVRVGTTSRAVTAYVGAELLRATARAVGVGKAVEASVSLKKRARGLSEAEFVMGITESIALGARCLDDLAVARSDVVQAHLRGFDVPAPQTAGTWLRRFTLGHLGQLNRLYATKRGWRPLIVATGRVCQRLLHRPAVGGARVRTSTSS
jgi:hypothetical protein